MITHEFFLLISQSEKLRLKRFLRSARILLLYRFCHFRLLPLVALVVYQYDSVAQTIFHHVGYLALIYYLKRSQPKYLHRVNHLILYIQNLHHQIYHQHEVPS